MSEPKNLLLHKKTSAEAKAFLKKPSHALLITGQTGSGKLHLALHLASNLLRISDQQLTNYPYFTHLKRPEGKQDIPVDAIRQVTRILKLKSTGSNNIRRVVIIEDAEDLNDESANALLKMLEEPAQDIVFILTASSTSSVLPTIASRAQKLTVYPLALNNTLDFWAEDYSTQKIERAWRLSEGGAGLMTALLNGHDNHPLIRAIEESKAYLAKDKYEKLLEIDELAKDKPGLRLRLEALIKLLRVIHHAEVKRGNEVQQKRLLAGRKLVNKLLDALGANASPKLIALELSLNLL